MALNFVPSSHASNNNQGAVVCQQYSALKANNRRYLSLRKHLSPLLPAYRPAIAFLILPSRNTALLKSIRSDLDRTRAQH